MPTLQGILRARPPNFCGAIWVPSHATQALDDLDLEEKRLKKLLRARAQPGWSEDWLVFNDRADTVAGRANARRARRQE